MQNGELFLQNSPLFRYPKPAIFFLNFRILKLNLSDYFGEMFLI